MLQDLWHEHQHLMVTRDSLEKRAEACEDPNYEPVEKELRAVSDKLHDETDCAIADTMPETIEECLIHARLLAGMYCLPDNSNWTGKQDARLAKSLLTGLERLAGRAEI